jgi:quercetin dioxygenase-like cupin family protein
MTTLDELKIDTQHLHTDELPWVSDGKVAHRILLAREDTGLVVMHWRASPGVASGLHRHLGAVLVYTISGTWSHRPDVMDYRTGSYVTEPVNALHRFYAGPDPVEALGYSWGVTESIGPDGSVTGVQTLQTKVEHYLRLCKAQGFGQPKILG